MLARIRRRIFLGGWGGDCGRTFGGLPTTKNGPGVRARAAGALDRAGETRPRLRAPPRHRVLQLHGEDK